LALSLHQREARRGGGVICGAGEAPDADAVKQQQFSFDAQWRD
jgi:hypothetical protein